ncbi:MAG: hypothetical protein V9G04_03245 [Nocardioides sp.]|jgi:hypothetical protein
MTILKSALVLLHFIGFAALLGGLLVQVREPIKRVLPIMRDGIATAFVAGILIVGVLEADKDADVNHAKIGVKFTVALIVFVLTMVNMRKERIPNGLFWGLLGLTLLNMGVAVFW